MIKESKARIVRHRWHFYECFPELPNTNLNTYQKTSNDARERAVLSTKNDLNSYYLHRSKRLIVKEGQPDLRRLLDHGWNGCRIGRFTASACNLEGLQPSRRLYGERCVPSMNNAFHLYELLLML